MLVIKIGSWYLKLCMVDAEESSYRQNKLVHGDKEDHKSDKEETTAQIVDARKSIIFHQLFFLNDFDWKRRQVVP